MVWLVGALLLLWVAQGPVVLVLAAALLAIPRVRWWVQDDRSLRDPQQQERDDQPDHRATLGESHPSHREAHRG